MKQKIRFRASEVGALMVDAKATFTPNMAQQLEQLRQKASGSALTATQAKQLEELLQKREQKALSPAQQEKLEKLEAKAKADPLTPKQRERLEELELRAAAPFELSETAKALVRKVWLRRELGYNEPLISDELLKGQMCEQDALAILTMAGQNSLAPHVPDYGFRIKNNTKYESDFFTGTPDVVIPESKVIFGAVEDVKSSFSLRTFISAEPNKLYYTQGQVYMHLTGTNNFGLAYCLVETPEELLERMEKKFLRAYGYDEDNPHYIEAVRQLRFNHIELPRRLHSQHLVRYFKFSLDEDFINELIKRVKLASNYYEELTEIFNKSGFTNEMQLP